MIERIIALSIVLLFFVVLCIEEYIHWRTEKWGNQQWTRSEDREKETSWQTHQIQN
jgi:hypothetical protein